MNNNNDKTNNHTTTNNDNSPVNGGSAEHETSKPAPVAPATPGTRASKWPKLRVGSGGRPRRPVLRHEALLVFDVDATGDGIVLARTAGRDELGGDSADLQAQAVREFAKQQGLCPRKLITARGISGMRRFDDAPHLAVTVQAIEEGWCRWVAVRDIARISRSVSTTSRFFDLLGEHSVDLYVQQFGRKVDWEQDELMLTAMMLEHQYDARARGRIMRDALKFQWVEAGRGWPGAGKLGCRRDSENYLEVDPQQWPAVLYAFQRYAEMGAEGRASIKRLQQELAERGFTVSAVSIGRLLRDEFYTSGEWSVRVSNTEVRCTPVHLAEPVPVEVFERVQELLDRRRRRAG